MDVQKRKFKTVTFAFIGMDGKPVDLINSEMPTSLVLHFRRFGPATPL
jgi:hypothetical protein